MEHETVAIFGAPGTGKTTHLTELVSDLSKKTPNVAVLSFTKVAANVLAKRLTVDIRTVATLHSLCFNYFNLKKKQIANDSGFEKHAGQDIVKQFMPVYSYWRAYNDRIKFEECAEKFNNYLPLSQLVYIKDTYEKWKGHNGLIDFFDLLQMGIDVIHKYDYVIVDEAQDLSYLQMDLINTLVKPNGIIYMAGDDDQSIYGFTGADPNILIDQENKVILDQSYRLPKMVYDTALKFIRSTVKNRQDKEFNHRGSDGGITFFNHANPALWDYFDKYTVLCRDNYLVEDVKQELMSLGISFSTKSPNVRSPFNGLLANIIRAIKKDNTRYLVQKKKYIKSMSKANAQANWLDVVDLARFDPYTVNYLISIGDAILEPPRVNISTIHSFKGGEDDNVIVLAESNDLSASSFYDEDSESEYRVWYTAMTRSKKELCIVGHNNFLIKGDVYGTTGFIN